MESQVQYIYLEKILLGGAFFKHMLYKLFELVGLNYLPQNNLDIILKSSGRVAHSAVGLQFLKWFGNILTKWPIIWYN